MAERVKQVYGHLTRPDRRPMSGAQFPENSLTQHLPHLPELWKNVPLAPQDG